MHTSKYPGTVDLCTNARAGAGAVPPGARLVETSRPVAVRGVDVRSIPLINLPTFFPPLSPSLNHGQLRASLRAQAQRHGRGALQGRARHHQGERRADRPAGARADAAQVLRARVPRGPGQVQHRGHSRARQGHISSCVLVSKYAALMSK